MPSSTLPKQMPRFAATAGRRMFAVVDRWMRFTVTNGLTRFTAAVYWTGFLVGKPGMFKNVNVLFVFKEELRVQSDLETGIQKNYLRQRCVASSEVLLSQSISERRKGRWRN